MTTELKQAAQQAVDAFDAFGDADDFASLFELTQKMRALRTAIQQAEAQQPATTEPVLFIHPDTFAMNNSHVGAWKPGHELPGYIPLYNHPAPSVPADVVLDRYDAGLLNDFGGGNIEWWQDYIRAELGRAHDFYQSQLAPPQAEVTDGIRPEDFTVDVVVKSMGGFAQINTKGVRVTHKPTGISVTCDVARSQHANRNQAIETLRTILALRTERVPMTEEQVWNNDALMSANGTARFKLDALMRIVRAAEAHHGITAQAKKEGA